MEEQGSNDPGRGQYGLLVGGEVRYNVWTEHGELQFWITNKRKTRCLDCGTAVEASQGIRLHYPFNKSGFVCLAHAQARIERGGGVTDAYRIDAMGNLGPDFGHKGTVTWPAKEVAHSVVRMENGKPIKVE